jgi:hypothetical protein
MQILDTFVTVTGLEIMELGIQGFHLNHHDPRQDSARISLKIYQEYWRCFYEQQVGKGHRDACGGMGQEERVADPEGEVRGGGVAGPSIHQPDRPYDFY